MNDTTLPQLKSTRRKTAVKKGFALHDWKLLLNRSSDLAQRKGAPLRAITMEEVALHDKVHDGWMVLYGKVYNIGPYLHYHPGGVDILKPSLGKDGTELFEKYHRWIGIENLIGKLLLGYVDGAQNQMINMPPPRPKGMQLESLLTSPNDDDHEDSDDDDEAQMNPWMQKN
jgi:Cytochrome b involved in lipid metabolism